MRESIFSLWSVCKSASYLKLHQFSEEKKLRKKDYFFIAWIFTLKPDPNLGFLKIFYIKSSQKLFLRIGEMFYTMGFSMTVSLSLYHTHYYSPPLPHSTHSHQQHTMGVLYKDNFWPTVNHTGISQYREYLTPSYAPGGYIAPLPLHILYRIAPAGGRVLLRGYAPPLSSTENCNYGPREKWKKKCRFNMCLQTIFFELTINMT